MQGIGGSRNVVMSKVSSKSDEPTEEVCPGDRIDGSRDAELVELEALLGPELSVSMPDSLPEDAALAGLPTRYRTLGPAGEGGMGRVYEAFDELLGRRVAIKVMTGRVPLLADMMRREREVLAALQDPGIVAVYDSGELAAGKLYCVMQFVEGPTLREYAAANRLAVRDVVRLVAEVARAVGVAHLVSIVHRDLKPDNVKIGAGGRPIVLDFGLAEFTRQGNKERPRGETAKSPSPAGTRAYMSPEQARGAEVDPRSDVYSLGVVLYELLTGRLPIDPDDVPIGELDGHPHCRAAVPIRQHRPGVPTDLAAVVQKCLTPDPAERYASAVVLAEDLELFLADRPVRALPDSNPWYPARKFVRRHWLPTLIAGCGVSAVVVVTALAFVRVSEQRRRAEQNANLANEQRVLAELREQATRDYLYAANVKLAGHAWRNADVGQVLELLGVSTDPSDRREERGFEWWFLWRQCHADRATFLGHEGDVYHAVFSPDGSRIASCGIDASVRVWSPAGETHCALWGHESEVNAVAFSSDATRLASASDDGTVGIWDLSTGERTHVLCGHDGCVTSALWLPDGRVVSSGDDGRLLLWDLACGGPPDLLADSLPAVNAFDYSPERNQLAVAAGHRIVIVDVAMRRTVWTLNGHSADVLTVAFSPEGRLLASAGRDRAVRVWDLLDPRNDAQRLDGHNDWVHGLAFLPDGKLLASAGKDGQVVLWDIATGKRVRELLGHVGRIWSIHTDNAGHRLVTTGEDGTVKIFAVADATANDGWQTTQAEPMALAYSPSGASLAVATADGLVTSWALNGDHRRALLPGHTAGVGDLAFLSDELLASVNIRGAPVLWDLTTQSPRPLDAEPNDWAWSIAASPDGQRVASGSVHGSIAVWDVATGTLVARAAGHQHAIRSIDLSPTGRWIATGSDDETVRLWDAASASGSHVLGRHNGGVACVAFSPTGDLLASGSADRTVKLWDVASGHERATLHAHQAAVTSVAFSPDGRSLVTGSTDRTVRIWNLATAQELFVLAAGPGPVRALCFAPDGRALAASFATPPGGAIQIWRVDKR